MDQLQLIYYDPANPGAFGGVKNLQKAANVSTNDAKKWLRSQPTYTLHKPVVRNFVRNKMIAYDKDEIWNADLVFMNAYARENDGFVYILTVIDLLSKFAWAVPLKDKTPGNVIKAFDIIFAKGRKCQRLHTDKGKEFTATSVQTYFKSHDIIHYTTQNEEIKAAVVERFNRTLKNRMFRYFTYKGTHRYVDVLQQLMEGYNKSLHRSIKMRPVDVTSEDDVVRAYENLYDNKLPRNPKAPSNFKVGDRVRLVHKKDVYTRGYFPLWSEEIYTVSGIKKRDPFDVFTLEDYLGEEVKGTYYAPELQKVDNPDEIYRVSEVLKTRKRKGRTEYFVSWLGYPASANSWVDNLKG